jgi:hypothetical protein
MISMWLLLVIMLLPHNLLLVAVLIILLFNILLLQTLAAIDNANHDVLCFAPLRLRLCFVLKVSWPMRCKGMPCGP